MAATPSDMGASDSSGKEHILEVVPLLAFEKESAKWGYCEPGLNFLSSLDPGFGILVVTGRPRIGKSFLATSFLKALLPSHIRVGKGFESRDTSASCTQGVSIFPYLLNSEPGASGNPFVVVDTQGICALDKDDSFEHFVLPVLFRLASCWLFMAVHSLDKEALQHLNSLTQIANQLDLKTTSGKSPPKRVKQGSEEPAPDKEQETEDKQEGDQEPLDPMLTMQKLSQEQACGPTLCVYIRNWELQAVDDNGRATDPDSYLKHQLSQFRQENRKRSSPTSGGAGLTTLADLFPVIKCCLIPPPQPQQQQQRKTHSDAFAEWLQQLPQLVGVKRVFGKAIGGKALVELLKTQLDDIYQERRSCIQQQWQKLASYGPKDASQGAIKLYKNSILSLVSSCFPAVRISTLRSLLVDARHAALRHYDQLSYGKADELAVERQGLRSRLSVYEPKLLDKYLVPLRLEIQKRVTDCVLEGGQRKPPDSEPDPPEDKGKGPSQTPPPCDPWGQVQSTVGKLRGMPFPFGLDLQKRCWVALCQQLEKNEETLLGTSKWKDLSQKLRRQAESGSSPFLLNRWQAPTKYLIPAHDGEEQQHCFDVHCGVTWNLFQVTWHQVCETAAGRWRQQHQKELAVLDEALELCQNESSILKVQRDSAKEQQSHLVEQNRSLQSNLKEKEDELKELTAQSAILLEQRQELESENLKYKTTEQKIQEKWGEFRLQQERCKKELDGLEAQVKALGEEKSRLEKERNHYKQQLTKSERELETLRNAQHQTLDEWIKKHDTQEAENRKMATEILDLKHHKEIHQVHLQYKDDRIRLLSQEKMEIENKQANCLSQIKELSMQIARRDADAAHLKTEFERREEELKKRDEAQKESIKSLNGSLEKTRSSQFRIEHELQELRMYKVLFESNTPRAVASLALVPREETSS